MQAKWNMLHFKTVGNATKQAATCGHNRCVDHAYAALRESAERTGPSMLISLQGALIPREAQKLGAVLDEIASIQSFQSLLLMS